MWFRRRALLAEGGGARVGGNLVGPLWDGKGGRAWSESESELMNGSKVFAAGLLLRWANIMGPSTCEAWIGGEGWRTLLRRECP